MTRASEDPGAPRVAEISEPESPPAGRSGRGAAVVSLGILLSRLSGLARERAIAYFFGATPVADAWKAALRMPNVLQNLLGEGTLSASFIPIYAAMEEDERHEASRAFAGAIFGLLFVVAGLLALIGIALAPILVAIFFGGFDPTVQELTVALVRILFPMTAVLVLSAWCLGILNSHRHFLLSYSAPVVWNLAMLAALGFGAWSLGPEAGWTLEQAGEELVRILAWGALVGGGLQFLVQLPTALRLLGGFRPRISLAVEGVRRAISNFVPVVMARGAVNLGGWLDYALASYLAAGAVASLSYAQTLYILPISLFGMAIAASELPELSRARAAGASEAAGSVERADPGEPGAAAGRGDGVRERIPAATREALARQVQVGIHRVTFFLVPAVLGYIALGDVVVAGLYQTGAFGQAEVLVAWAALGAYALGMGASAVSRLLSSSFYALEDTKTPARAAWIRVTLALAVGALLMFPFDRIPAGDGLRLGAMGLALGSALASWVELGILRRALTRRIGPHGMAPGTLGRLLIAGGFGVGAGWAALLLVPALPAAMAHPVLTALIVLPALGLTYFGAALLLGVGEPLRALAGRSGK